MRFSLFIWKLGLSSDNAARAQTTMHTVQPCTVNRHVLGYRMYSDTERLLNSAPTGHNRHRYLQTYKSCSGGQDALVNFRSIEKPR